MYNNNRREYWFYLHKWYVSYSEKEDCRFEGLLRQNFNVITKKGRVTFGLERSMEVIQIKSLICTSRFLCYAESLQKQQILLLKLFTSFSENCWTIQFHLGVSLFSTIVGVLMFANWITSWKKINNRTLLLRTASAQECLTFLEVTVKRILKEDACIRNLLANVRISKWGSVVAQ